MLRQVMGGSTARKPTGIFKGGSLRYPSCASQQTNRRLRRSAQGFCKQRTSLAGGQDAVIVKQRLNELGYSEGKNLIFDYRSAEGQLERLPQLAAESVATNPDVVRLQMVWDNLSCLGTEALARLG